MEHANGIVDVVAPILVNGKHTNGIHEPSLEELENELPMVQEGQVPLGDVLSRVVQAIYAEMIELTETMPNMSDVTRKRILADWVVKTKKQVVKLYAVVKWSRDADTVQKCMNITAFLLNQNQQFDDAVVALKYAKESLDPARLRNHDLLTSLDVLTTGSYLRLPTCIQKAVIPPEPLTDSDVLQTLKDMEDAMRYRLRMHEIIPVEMSQHRIADGRVWFTVPNLFETAICLQGAENDAGWFFAQVEFLLNVGGDLAGVQEFPRIPTGAMKRHITDEADARLAFYLPVPPDQLPPPGVDIPPKPQLPAGVVDTPLVRLFNFLQMMSLSYQLEILWFQAMRMRSLGWADYLKVDMTINRKTLTVSYWIRQPQKNVPARAPRLKVPLPPVGGTLTISIVEAREPIQAGGGPARSPKARVLADLQLKSKLGASRPSDEVEGLLFDVKWQPMKGALGVILPPAVLELSSGELSINAGDLNFEAILRRVIERHSKAILTIFLSQLQNRNTPTAFSPPGAVSLITSNNVPALRAHLCAEEVVIVSIDPRTGKLNLRETGDLAAAGRSHRFENIADALNLNPAAILQALMHLRRFTITDLAEQKAQYLGLHTSQTRNFLPDELRKLGPSVRGTLYISLSNSPYHYLVLVIADEDLRYALISVKVHSDTMYAHMTMEDIGWLDVRRIHGDELVISSPPRVNEGEGGVEVRRKLDPAEGRVEHKEFDISKFSVDTQVLRELYSYCCARVAYTKVEQQFKLRGIPYIHVNPGPLTPELAHVQSSLAQSVPALCVQSSDILSGAPAAEAAMPNIRVIPLNWWSNKKAQVVTCVKLKYVQQPMGKTAGTSNIIRPSKRIIYDTTEAVVSFLSEEVDTCVTEFLEEWARVSKMVVIAREVGKMAKDQEWKGVRLLSFDLQTVEFAYAEDFTVSITCTDQLSPSGGSFDLRFSRCDQPTDSDAFNAHSNAEPYFRNILRHGHGRLAPSLQRLVSLLRDTLPIVAELEELRVEAEQDGEHVDTFAKAAGWYRMLYGDSSHALDWRLVSGDNIAILDPSYLTYVDDHSTSGAETAPVEISASSSSPKKSPKVSAKSARSTIQPAKQPVATTTGPGFRPIPHFREIVTDVVREVQTEGARVAGIDVGVICDQTAVRAIGRALHLRVLTEIRSKIR